MGLQDAGGLRLSLEAGQMWPFGCEPEVFRKPGMEYVVPNRKPGEE